MPSETDPGLYIWFSLAHSTHIHSFKLALKQQVALERVEMEEKMVSTQEMTVNKEEKGQGMLGVSHT